jgi:hypothetical protein
VRPVRPELNGPKRTVSLGSILPVAAASRQNLALILFWTSTAVVVSVLLPPPGAAKIGKVPS